MRLIDADELIEHVWRDRLDSRELIAEMINNAPTVKDIPTNVPISVFEQLISKCVEHDLRAYSDGVNDVLDEIKADIEQECKVESEHPYGQGLSRALEIIDRYKSEGRK